MRAATYARFSTDRQNESSIADQVRVCTEYAAREGLQVVEHFEDLGISGAALGNRPGALRLMEAALARRFDAVLATDLSRLSRSNGDLSKMIDRLVARGIRVIGVQDGYDSERKGHKLQAGLSGIIGEAFRDMIRDRTHAALESRAKERRPTGGKCYGYAREGSVCEAEAAVVRKIFERYADGASCRTVAAELNARRVPSPGSAWERTERRAAGWMGSAIRVIVKNERYTGRVVWNQSAWFKDPDTGKRTRRMRPRSEWIEHRDESLRIVSDELFQRAQRRTRLGDDERLKAGGKAKYLLSGLLVCDRCGAHYVMSDPRSYACSSHVSGKACDNSIRVKRSAVESVILDPIREDLLTPDRVERMAREMRAAYSERVRLAASRAETAPKELQELDARIGRLRERLRRGDPDLEPDELQAAIDQAETKRREMLDAQPAARQGARVLGMLPRAAQEYRRQIAEGLDGNSRAALKARVVLKELLGKIRLVPGSDGSLWAEYKVHPGALLRGCGTSGSGGLLCLHLTTRAAAATVMSWCIHLAPYPSTADTQIFR